VNTGHRRLILSTLAILPFGIGWWLTGSHAWVAALFALFAGACVMVLYALLGEQDAWDEDLPFRWRRAWMLGGYGMVVATWPAVLHALSAPWWDALARLHLLWLLARMDGAMDRNRWLSRPLVLGLAGWIVYLGVTG
jgi:hypothetical protein